MSEPILKGIKSHIEVKNIIREAQNYQCIALDTETTGLDWLVEKVLGVGICFNEKESYYIQYEYFDKERDSWNKLFKEKEIVFHNAKFDIHMLKDYSFTNIHDTMLMDYLLRPEIFGKDSRKLKHLSEKYLGISGLLDFDDYINSLKPKEKKLARFDTLPEEKQTQYAAKDPYLTLRLFNFLYRQIKEKNLSKLEELESKCCIVLEHIERNGIKVDIKKLEIIGNIIKEKLIFLNTEFLKLTKNKEVNINSSEQVGEILFNKIGVPILKRSAKTNEPSTDEPSLTPFRDKFKIVDILLTYRELEKLRGTYIDGLKAGLYNNICHTNFSQTKSTGRTSSRKDKKTGRGANLQNIAKNDEYRIRDMFIPHNPKGYLVSLDYSQIEFKIMVELSNQTDLITEIQNGKDCHQATADLTGLSRSQAKSINFGLLYGMTPYGLSYHLKTTPEEAQEFFDIYFEKLSMVKMYINSLHDFAKNNKYITTYYGRIRYFKNLYPKLYTESKKDYYKRVNPELNKVVSTRIQGTAADFLKVALVRTHKMIQEKYSKTAKIVNQVHDQIIVSTDPEINLREFIKDFTEAMEFNIPSWRLKLKTDCAIGKSWGKLHELKKWRIK